MSYAIFDFVLIVALLYSGIKLYTYHRLEMASKKWPVVEATVQRSDGTYSSPSTGLFAPRLARSLFGYSYTIAGVRYIGFFSIAKDDPLSGIALQDELNGKAINVRYDPDSPNRSFVVEKTIAGKRIHQNPDWVASSIRFGNNSSVVRRPNS